MVDDLVQLDPPGWAKSTIRELFELDPPGCASSTTKLFQLDRFVGSGFGVWGYVHGLIANSDSHRGVWGGIFRALRNGQC